MKISVITATFNSAATIGDALASLHGQRHQDLEHLVVDGLSTDATLAVVASRADGRTVVRSERDRGLYDALNKGLARCTGEIVGFLHSDDAYVDAAVLEEVASAFEDPAVEAVYGDLEYVSRRDPTRLVRHWRSGEYRPGLLREGWMPPHPTLHVRRRVYEAVGGFDTRYRIAADYDSVLRILRALTRPPVYLPRTLVRMRLGGASNRSISHLLTKSAEDLRIVRAHRVGGVGTILAKNFRKLPQFLGWLR